MKELANSNIAVAFFIGAISMAAFLQLKYYRSESVRINKHKIKKVAVFKVLDLLETEYVEIVLDRQSCCKGYC